MCEIVEHWKGRFAAWRRLSSFDRWLLIQAVTVVSLIGLLLKVCTLRSVYLTMASYHGVHSAGRGQDGRAGTHVAHIAQFVDRASRYALLSNTCLQRSLALWWMLGRRGFNVTFQVGVRRRGALFEAHAWVEYGDEVVSDCDAVEGGYAEVSWLPLRNHA
jgi:hypothetical protein